MATLLQATGGEPRLPLLLEALAGSRGEMGHWGALSAPPAFPFHLSQTHSTKPKGGDGNTSDVDGTGLPPG